MMKPRLVLEIQDARGERVRSYAPEGRRVLPREVADHLLEMMRGVTEQGGTGRAAAMDRYTVAGKTGTAQKVDPVTRTYSRDRWVSSFMGAVPASRPRIVAVIVVNEPAGEKYYGGEVAGPIFKRIASRSLAYLGVEPDKEAPRREQGEPRRRIAEAAEGYVDMERYPPLPGEGAGAEEILVPDFTGMSIGEVISTARKVGLTVRLKGSGRAVAQSPGPGPVGRAAVCRVSFRSPG
jgi:cell division protein FtsI (penicillin-binding protein 3)